MDHTYSLSNKDMFVHPHAAFLQLVDFCSFFFSGVGGGVVVFKHITLLTDLVHFEAQWFCPETAEAKWGKMLAILDFGNRCHTFGL